MLDLTLIRQQPDLVKTSLTNRQKDPTLVDSFLEIDKQYRLLLVEIETLRSQQNQISRTSQGKPTADQISEAKILKDKLTQLVTQQSELQLQIDSLVDQIPNLPSDDTPVGATDADNVVFKKIGKAPTFSFTPKDHIDLGEQLDILDVKKASDLSGSRFGYFKNQAAILEMSLMFYCFQKLVKKGFKAMVPPAMIKSKTEWGCGYTSNKNLFNAGYSIPEDDLIFISSSEHSVVPYHSNEILSSDTLPLKYVNYSPCFRREAGTYGKDTRGMFRVHYFNKVEMNVFTLPDFDISDKMCQEMLTIEEEILSDLDLSYQVMKCCTGDLPQPNRRMFDINTWFPGQNAFRETHSCSNCSDYQARRLNTKVKINGKNEFVHILNATVITDRAVLAILENHQQADGSVLIPTCLQPFTGFDRITPT
jgi:seryl-tRNA synthetase